MQRKIGVGRAESHPKRMAGREDARLMSQPLKLSMESKQMSLNTTRLLRVVRQNMTNAHSESLRCGHCLTLKALNANLLGLRHPARATLMQSSIPLIPVQLDVGQGHSYSPPPGGGRVDEGLRKQARQTSYELA